MNATPVTGLPDIVDRAEWRKQLDAFRAREKEATAAHDALSA
nr:DUF899 family protein [Zavarzinella formosa]